MNAKLNARQLRFAHGVIAGKPASVAYAEAGFEVATDETAESCASRLLSLAKVQKYVDAAMERSARRVGVTRDQILGELCRIAFEDPEAKPRDKIRALEVLGKNLGLWLDKTEVSTSPGQPLEIALKNAPDLSKMSDDELAEYDARLAAEEAGGIGRGEGSPASGAAPPQPG